MINYKSKIRLSKHVVRTYGTRLVNYHYYVKKYPHFRFKMGSNIKTNESVCIHGRQMKPKQTWDAMREPTLAHRTCANCKWGVNDECTNEALPFPNLGYCFGWYRLKGIEIKENAFTVDVRWDNYEMKDARVRDIQEGWTLK